MIRSKRKILLRVGLTCFCFLSREHGVVLPVFEEFDKALHLLNSPLKKSNLHLALLVSGPHLVQDSLEAVVGQAYGLELTAVGAKHRVALHL